MWYGWIPILSGKLFLEKEEDIEKRAKDLQKEIKEQEGYPYLIEHTHESRDKWKIILRTKRLTRRIELQFEVKLEDNGLCKIKPISGDPSYDAALAIYRFIRDVYHKHIHHSGDLPLRPVEVDAENDAIEGILNQYRQKVILYHRIAKDLIDSRRVGVAIKEICAGRGEMQYAKTFITLFITGNQKGDLIRIFENSDTSLGVLMERINAYLSMLSFTREKKRDVFSIIITAILIFLTEFSILTNLFGWQPSFFFWSLFPALIVMAFGLTLLATNSKMTP